MGRVVRARAGALALAAALALALAGAGAPAGAAQGGLDDGALFPGWDGERGGRAGKVPREQLRMLSWKPRVVEHRGFLIAAECDAIIDAAKVLGDAVDEPEGAVLAPDDVSYAAQRALAHADASAERTSMMPAQNAGVWRVRRLTHESAEEDAQLDTIAGLAPGKRLPPGGQVAGVVVVFLSDAPLGGGGEQVFPDADLSASSWERDKGLRWSKCATRGSPLAVSPRKGDALLSWALDNALREDARASRKACPPADGEVWIATKVMYTNSLLEGSG